MNQALLCKWFWRYDLEEESLWRKVVFAKFGVCDGWNLSVPHGAYGHSAWRAIMKHLNKFVSGIDYEVGNGRRIGFWLDAWCGGIPLAMEYPDMFAIAEDPNTVVSRYFSAVGHEVV